MHTTYTNKLRSLPELLEECAAWRKAGKRIVWTNGCFDIFHAGHARALETARAQGDVLIVGLNSDASVRGLKGEGRPLCNQDDRAAVLSALESVTRILLFDGIRCDRELAALQPDVWTKSGDYTPESLDPAEREAVTSHGGRIVITPLIPGISTTLLVKKIRRFDPEKIVSAACSFIQDRRGRLLLVKTRYTDALKWGLPGGGHQQNESLVDTARREALEETGLEMEIGRHMGVIERVEPALALHLTMHVFAAAPRDPASLDRDVFQPQPGEYVEDVAWFDAERLRNEPGIVLGRRLWLEYGGSPENWPPYILMRQGEE